MKKLIFLLLAVALLLPKNAFALGSNDSPALSEGDRAWSVVTVSSGENTLVSAGTALVYNADDNSPRQAEREVRVARASADNSLIAGFAQQSISSGYSAQILVRGFGLVRQTGGVASGDSLYVAASGNVTSNSAGTASSNPVAVAVDATNSNGTPVNAWIKVI